MTTQRQIEDLSVDECMDLLASYEFGRLAYIRDGKPEIVPFNYRFHEGAVVLRTSWGAVIDAVHHQAVAFEVDEPLVETRSGWSVVVHGIAEEIWQEEELARARELPLEPWAPGEREHFLQISPSSITGRRVS